MWPIFLNQLRTKEAGVILQRFQHRRKQKQKRKLARRGGYK